MCGAVGHNFLAVEVYTSLLEVRIAFVSLKIAKKRIKHARYNL
jgi:hypothetical protein